MERIVEKYYKPIVRSKYRVVDGGKDGVELIYDIEGNITTVNVWEKNFLKLSFELEEYYDSDYDFVVECQEFVNEFLNHFPSDFDNFDIDSIIQPEDYLEKYCKSQRYAGYLFLGYVSEFTIYTGKTRLTFKYNITFWCYWTFELEKNEKIVTSLKCIEQDVDESVLTFEFTHNDQTQILTYKAEEDVDE